MLKKVLVLMLLIAVMVPSYAVMGMEEEDEPQSPKVFIPKEMISEDELLERYSEKSERQEKPRIILYSSNKIDTCGYVVATGSTILGFMGPGGKIAGPAFGYFGVWYCSNYG